MFFFVYPWPLLRNFHVFTAQEQCQLMFCIVWATFAWLESLNRKVIWNNLKLFASLRPPKCVPDEGAARGARASVTHRPPPPTTLSCSNCLTRLPLTSSRRRVAPQKVITSQHCGASTLASFLFYSSTAILSLICLQLVKMCTTQGNEGSFE